MKSSFINISRKYLEHILNISRTCLGNIWNISRTNLENIWKVSGCRKYPEHIQKIFINWLAKQIHLVERHVFVLAPEIASFSLGHWLICPPSLHPPIHRPPLTTFDRYRPTTDRPRSRSSETPALQRNCKIRPETKRTKETIVQQSKQCIIRSRSCVCIYILYIIYYILFIIYYIIYICL